MRDFGPIFEVGTNLTYLPESMQADEAFESKFRAQGSVAPDPDISTTDLITLGLI